MGETTYRTESEIPVLPLRDMVVFPHGVHPLFVGTESSIRALDEAMSLDKVIFLVAKKDAEEQIAKEDDLYQFGTIARILQLLKLPDGTVKILVEGQSRARVENYILSQDFIRANLSVIEDDEPIFGGNCCRTHRIGRRGRCQGGSHNSLLVRYLLGPVWRCCAGTHRHYGKHHYRKKPHSQCQRDLRHRIVRSAISAFPKHNPSPCR